MDKIVLTGGGTAGHVYPALAVKEYFENKYEIHYIGSCGMEKQIIEKEQNITFHQISSTKLQRKITPKNILIPFKLLHAISQAKKILTTINPVAVFSKGGYVALPVVIAAWMLKIKIVSHESDLSMGLANRIILKFCDKMCVAFQQTAHCSKKCIYTGQPIRKNILNGDKHKLDFYRKLNKNLPCLLVVGGSSGAGFLNKITQENIDWLTRQFNILHITGKNKNEKINAENYFQIEYAHNMGDFLNCADFVLSRAGSGAINEFLALQKPMFLLPLSRACSRGDQIENAKLFEKLGYCIMMEEEDYSKEIFIDKIKKLKQNDKIFIKNMQKSIKNDASKEIYNVIEELIKNKSS